MEERIFISLNLSYFAQKNSIQSWKKKKLKLERKRLHLQVGTTDSCDLCIFMPFRRST